MLNIDILQVEFPSHCTFVSIIGDKLLCCGSYKPQLHLYDLINQTQIINRTVDCEILKAEYVETQSDKKYILLRSDNVLEFHTKAGYYHSFKNTRVKGALRDIDLNGNLLNMAYSYDLVLLDLEKGIERKIDDKIPQAVNIRSSGNNLYLSTDESIRHYDVRMNSLCSEVSLKGLAIPTTLNLTDKEYIIGTKCGNVYTFNDGRVLSKVEINKGFPILDMKYKNDRLLTVTEQMFSAYKNDEKILEYKKEGMKVFDINEGVVIIGGDYKNVDVFYDEKIGSIPRWCKDINLLL